jgi:hypothetical protein
MSNSNSKIHINLLGGNFAGLLTILFIGLKLTGHIDWSWWWVLSPLWIGLAIILGIIAFGLLIAGFVLLVAALFGAVANPRVRVRDRRDSIYGDDRPTVDEMNREIEDAEIRERSQNILNDKA